MRHITLLVALLILPLLGCSDSGPLEVTSPGSQLDTATPTQVAVERPFGGHWQTTFDNFDPVEGTIEIHGIGFATYLGSSTFDTVQPLAPYVEFPATLNAANGDELHYTAIGYPPGDGDPFTFSGTLWFTGGTGRFSNATGSADYEGTASLVTMTGEVTYKGTIAF